MNRIITLLVIAQFICLSQSAQVKRASDACPGSNNKTSTSKEYAHLSKRSAAKDNSDFSKPKYQSIYAKNTSANTTARRGRAITKEERVVKTESVRSEKQTAPVVKEEKNNSGKVSAEPIVEDEFEQSTTSEKKAETSKPMDIIQTEKVVAPETKSEVRKDEGKTASSKKSEKTSAKNESTKSNYLTTTKATKQKQQKKTGIKKLRVGKKCATDCPEF